MTVVKFFSVTFDCFFEINLDDYVEEIKLAKERSSNDF